MQSVIGLGFHLSAMQDVDHDALWRLSSLEPHCTFANERSGRLFIQMTTLSSNRPRKIQTTVVATCSQTETSSRKNLYVNVELHLVPTELTEVYLVKEPAETRYGIDIRKVELHKIWHASVVLTGGTLASSTRVAPASESQGLGHGRGLGRGWFSRSMTIKAKEAIWRGKVVGEGKK